MHTAMLQEDLFSLPINPKIDPEYIDGKIIPFLNKHKHLIYDLYFTTRMPPFMQDAMGDVFRGTGDAQAAIKNAFYIRDKTGLPLSATFNNIWVKPDQKNLEEFITNFKFLYDNGVRTATIPHTSWVMTGQIQKAYPELKIKNTILREVSKPNEIVSLASAGFYYINLDRDVMRDRPLLDRIKEAKEYCAEKGNPVMLSLLANEHCWGGCPIMPEHYHYNSTRKDSDPQYFDSDISRVSCSRWDQYDPAFSLKEANLPPWREDWEEFLDVIDVFKLHGRESATRLVESLDLIRRWDEGKDILYPEFDRYLTDVKIKDAPINIWRNKIKSCRFDCWDCNYCESVVESVLKKEKRTMNPYVDRVIRAIDAATDNNSRFNPEGYDVLGLSSNKVRHLLNNLCSERGTVYADVVCYMGSTLFAALYKNSAVNAYAIDDYSDGIVKPKKKDLGNKFDVENPVDEMVKNADKWMNLDTSVGFCVKPVLQWLPNKEYRPDVIFYDGEVGDNMVANLEHLHEQAKDNYILVIDDANFNGVVDNAKKFQEDKEVVFEKTLRTEVAEDDKSWWNGLHILVITK